MQTKIADRNILKQIYISTLRQIAGFSDYFPARLPLIHFYRLLQKNLSRAGTLYKTPKPKRNPIHLPIALGAHLPSNQTGALRLRLRAIRSDMNKRFYPKHYLSPLKHKSGSSATWQQGCRATNPCSYTLFPSSSKPQSGQKATCRSPHPYFEVPPSRRKTCTPMSAYTV